MSEITTQRVYELLAEVSDPEIPVLSLVDLGVITAVTVQGDHVIIEMTPTFVGCPALETMQNEIRELLVKNGINKIDIEVTYRKPWTSDMISEKGKQALKKFGLAPPPSRQLFIDLDVLEHAECPRCGKTNTELKNTFGPTLCRSIHYCNDCREAFEQFKPL
ncbi:MAG: 1,2-phenylacetyl-CoA epoxidase subunit PaaD [Cyclobacteriaceae bacterium]